jgi:hypothetical protein
VGWPRSRAAGYLGQSAIGDHSRNEVLNKARSHRRQNESAAPGWAVPRRAAVREPVAYAPGVAVHAGAEERGLADAAEGGGGEGHHSTACDPAAQPSKRA